MQGGKEAFFEQLASTAASLFKPPVLFSTNFIPQHLIT
jgi:hypothetical protein